VRVGSPDEASSGVGEPPAETFRCDFCGEEARNVRRVALDRGYDRLRTPHQVRYACPSCSEKKDRERRARG
jgi:hypothetical protein